MEQAMKKSLLKKIVGSPQLEARWLNTLSLLEFIGSRKIAKTVCADGHPAENVLKHYADETRHAHAFRALSANLSGERGRDDYLCHDQAISYFQLLDQFVGEWLEENIKENLPHNNYLLVTTLVEKRAMKLYPLYRALTQNPTVQDELQKIILEESSHKPAIETAAHALLKQHGLKLKPCEKIEVQLFGTFEDAVERELGA